MSRFYTKSWFCYVAPFLLFFALSEAATYLPNWYFHIYLAKIFSTAGLLWAWRSTFYKDLTTKLTSSQLFISLFAGIISVATWLICINYEWVILPAHTIPEQWPLILKVSVVGLISLGASFVVPILSELFWRSFMLRYIIEQDFKSVAIGQFQFFSFIVVVALTTLPTNYIIPIALTCIIQNSLIVWQKNLRCCIVANMLSSTALTLYCILYGYQIL
ncbi:MAG: CAAX prenyl protease-related protein [Desulfuromonadales bacterium C00003068]|jgi:CAAX prenyl protease-like protein|nr:MAG: CAAX prenyl protease-related protein [Desulfuromonadales bacterium C00003068]